MAGAERPAFRPIQEQESKKPVSEISLEDGTVLRGFEITQKFWEMAEADGAFQRFINTDIKSTKKSGYIKSIRKRDVQVCTSFIKNPNTTFDKCGEEFGINSTRISKLIIENTPALVWKFTSENIQRQFPLESLSQQKPMSIKTIKEMSQNPWTKRINTNIISILIETSENRQEAFDKMTSHALKALTKAEVIVLLRSVLPKGENRIPRSLKSIAEFLKEDRKGKDKIAVGQLTERFKSGETTRFFLAAADAEKARSILAQYPNLHSL